MASVEPVGDQPAWLQAAIARWGKPRLQFDTSIPADGKRARPLNTDDGWCHRQGWNWFIPAGGRPLVNTGVMIDTFIKGGRHRIEVWQHTSPTPRAEAWLNEAVAVGEEPVASFEQMVHQRIEQMIKMVWETE